MRSGVCQYYADFMAAYLDIPIDKIHVVRLGLNLEGYGEAPPHSGQERVKEESPFVIGYLARICPEKGLHLLVDAFHQVTKRIGVDKIRLKVTGYLGQRDTAYFEKIRQQIDAWGLTHAFEHSPQRGISLRSTCIVNPAWVNARFFIRIGIIFPPLARGVCVMSERKKIAAIITEYRPHSHADVIVTKFLKGFPTDEGLMQPRVEIASMYVDQFAENDLSRALAAEHNVPIYPSIVKALTRGGRELAVDGVLLIGEHGDYAWNEKEQHLYPRKYFMEQICGVFATSGRSVPVYNDKHLSYNWHDAKWMVDRAVQLGVPFMAGSSLPLGWRNPWLEHELGTPIAEAIAIGFSGLDIYGFHTLETLQCMVERRGGGETGVAAVTCLEGDAVWSAAKIGLWSYELAKAACDAIENKPAGTMEEHCKTPALFLVEYRDGLRGAILMLNGYVVDLAYAARIGGKIHATEFYLQNHPPHSHFSYLSLNIEEMFVTGVPMYPVERTLLTTGVLEAALDSRYRGHIRLETPHLDVTYRSYNAIPWRPTGRRPVGASLQPLPTGE